MLNLFIKIAVQRYNFFFNSQSISSFFFTFAVNFSEMKRKKAKIFFLALGLTAFVCALATSLLYLKIQSPAFNIDSNVDIFIDDRRDYTQLVETLTNDAQMKHPALFNRLAALMKFGPNNLKSGHYQITPNTSLPNAIRMFRNGQQTPVKITFNNIRLKNDLAERIGGQLMFGPERLLQKLNNPEICKNFGLDTITIVTLFIPNTYEMYWNISPDKFLERMKREHDRFWTETRIEKAAKIPLSPLQVSILASIVEEETALTEDYPIVAGLYINRLRKGMPLQADPTVKFAVGDFALKRILFAHLEVESPYNTYLHAGLPPGPIRIPSPTAIDAVLNFTDHNYLYMVANEDLSGHTRFATTLNEHNRNARRYQEALNRKGIK
jgi:UPF0755 protein